jgi:ABC-type multidrug transport system fused ATPase/permease subunit
MNINIIRSFYSIFIKDTRRFYDIMPYTYKIFLLFIFFVQFITALFESISIFTLTLFGISIGAPDIARNNIIISFIFDFFPSLKLFCVEQKNLVLFSAILVVISIILKNICTAISLILNCTLSEKTSLFIENKILIKYLNNNYYWHLSSINQEIIPKLFFRQNLGHLFNTMLNFYCYCICIIIITLILCITEFKLTILVFSFFSFISLITYTFIKQKIDNVSKQIFALDNAENKTLMTIKQGLRDIISFNNQTTFIEILLNYTKKRIKSQVFFLISPHIPSWLLEIAGFGTILIALTYLIGTNATISQIIASISLLILTAWRILPMISRAMSSIVVIRAQRPKGLVCLDLLDELNTNLLIYNKCDYLFKFKYKIYLQNIYFQYPEKIENAINNISLEIKKGDTVGLIGPSGSGKSTLALVLSGLVPIKRGKFLIDGLDMTQERLVAFSEKVGFVPQTPFLMDGTVADNVAFSRWGQEYDREDVVRACKLAAMDFVFDHPDGLDMRISAGGQGLSGGQAQRVAIARAIFAKPQVIIFDEATSALDQWNENAIRQTIEKMAGEMTIIIIAHRLTTVESCDNIYWLDNGMIKESGPPSVILPIYKQYGEVNDS